MKLKQTCLNCKWYHGILSGEGNYHFHEWCAFWEKRIPTKAENYECGLSDVESETAYCWAFEEYKFEWK